MKYQKKPQFPECPYLSKYSKRCFHKFAPTHCVFVKCNKKCPHYNDWYETIKILEEEEKSSYKPLKSKLKLFWREDENE